jgi:hypothetical protein
MITKEILYMFSKVVRDKYRLDMPYISYIEIGYDSKKRLGRLVNLSTKGACIEIVDRNGLPQDNSETTIQFLLPEHSEAFSIEARVAWARKQTDDKDSRFVNLGVKFQKLDASTYDCLWSFIIDTISSPIP